MSEVRYLKARYDPARNTGIGQVIWFLGVVILMAIGGGITDRVLVHASTAIEDKTAEAMHAIDMSVLAAGPPRRY